MSKAEQLADELIQIARYPNVRINATDPAIQKEAAALLRQQDALLKQALEALNSGKHELRWAAADAIEEHLK